MAWALLHTRHVWRAVPPRQLATHTGLPQPSTRAPHNLAGAARPLLTGVSLDLPADSLSVLSGPSGAGKTTLLHVLAGLSEATAGTILLGGAAAPRPASPAPAAAPARLRASGVVFQFPERHFLGSTLVEELTLGWPETGPGRTRLAQRAQQVLAAVGLSSTPLQARLSSLSDGYKRWVWGRWDWSRGWISGGEWLRGCLSGHLWGGTPRAIFHGQCTISRGGGDLTVSQGVESIVYRF